MKNLTFFLCLLLSFSAYSNDLDVFERLEGQTDVRQKDKLEFWAQFFLGRPYGPDGPLGEGKEGRFDQDPLYRFDTFDCTTFVETVISLSRSNTRSEFENTMARVRYKNGEISYVTRNHITSQAWIPRNIENGFFEDMTVFYPVVFQRRGSALIDYPNWLRFHKLSSLKLPFASEQQKLERLEELRVLAGSFEPSTVDIEYLSLKELLADWRLFKEAVKGPLIVNIVRPNWNLRHLIGTNLHVSHQGLLFKEDGALFFIHASSIGAVTKVPLKEYLEKFKDSETIKGINLLSPL